MKYRVGFVPNLIFRDCDIFYILDKEEIDITHNIQMPQSEDFYNEQDMNNFVDKIKDQGHRLYYIATFY